MSTVIVTHWFLRLPLLLPLLPLLLPDWPYFHALSSQWLGQLMGLFHASLVLLLALARLVVLPGSAEIVPYLVLRIPCYGVSGLAVTARFYFYFERLKSSNFYTVIWDAHRPVTAQTGGDADEVRNRPPRACALGPLLPDRSHNNRGCSHAARRGDRRLPAPDPSENPTCTPPLRYSWLSGA